MSQKLWRSKGVELDIRFFLVHFSSGCFFKPQEVVFWAGLLAFHLLTVNWYTKLVKMEFDNNMILNDSKMWTVQRFVSDFQPGKRVNNPTWLILVWNGWLNHQLIHLKHAWLGFGSWNTGECGEWIFLKMAGVPNFENYNPPKLTWLAEKSTMNEHVFWKMGNVSMLVFRAVYSGSLRWFLSIKILLCPFGIPSLHARCLILHHHFVIESYLAND